MNKEQIINEVYENYTQTKIIKTDSGETHISPIGHYNGMTKEEFINKCKIDSKFSEKWGLKIEERELSREERYVWYKANTHLIPPHFRNQAKEFEDKYVPTKLITITYNNETLEIYE